MSVEAILRKAKESAQVKDAFFAEHAPAIVRCAEALAKAFEAGGRLYVMGNGGSACDAQHAAVEFMHPIHAKRRAIPAIALGEPALLSAIGNDEDFALSFARQLQVLGKKGDVALAISTSGQSRNVNRALQVARELGLVTVGFSGRDGGKMGEWSDHFFRVGSFSIHRIQETHETLLHLLWDEVHLCRGEEDVL